MKQDRWIGVVMAALLVSSCSGDMWRSKNKLDESVLSKFGQKKVVEDAKANNDADSSYIAGEESLFSLGDGGLFGGGGDKKSMESIRADKLFAGAMEVVMALPIQVANREGGIISTDWKVDANTPNFRYRVNIHVTGKEPYGTVQVVVLKQELVHGVWEDRPSDAETSNAIIKTIRKRSQTANPEK